MHWHYRNTCSWLAPEGFINSLFHSSSVPPFICSFMLPVLHLWSLSELPLFIRLCPPPISQQVAQISSRVLFTLIGQSIDRLCAGASTQLRQLHKDGHSISCRILHSFIKSPSAKWDFYVWFISFISLCSHK